MEIVPERKERSAPILDFGPPWRDLLGPKLPIRYLVHRTIHYCCPEKTALGQGLRILHLKKGVTLAC
jgi:hypothetical protein